MLSHLSVKSATTAKNRECDQSFFEGLICLDLHLGRLTDLPLQRDIFNIVFGCGSYEWELICPFLNNGK